MKDFSIISEGVLSDVDSTLKMSDKTAKSLKMQEDIKKNMWAINAMYNSSTYYPKPGQDKFKRDIKVGIVDLTRKRDTYTLYTYDNEGKRAIAAESMKYASNGLNEPLVYGKLSIYTGVPGEDRKQYKFN